MRSLQLEAFGPEHIRAVDAPTPHPAPGQVLVGLEAASLNYRDWLMVDGKLYRGVKLPLVPVSDGAGTVLDVGAGVTRFKPGDRVTTFYKSCWPGGAMRPEWEGAEIGGPAPGVMRDRACFDAYALAPAPAGLSSLQAATLPIAALTAWQALEEVHLSSGETVLLLGTGGVSLFALQFARMRGARVAMVSSSDEKLARVRAMGADITINYRKETEWGQAIRDATGGVHAVLETAGAATLAQSLNAVRMHGFVGLIGFITGTDAQLPITQAILKRVRLHGISAGSLEQHERMVRAIEANSLEPVIDSTFGFDQLRDAFAHLSSGTHFGKIVIDFSR